MSIETICVDLIGILAIAFAIIYSPKQSKTNKQIYSKYWDEKEELKTNKIKRRNNYV